MRLLGVLLVAILLGVTECANGHNKKNERPAELTAILAKNATRLATQSTTAKDNFYELNNKMLPSAKLTRSKRQTRVIVDRPRPRKLARRRPPFLPPRLQPMAKRRRFPKPPGKSKFYPKPPKVINHHHHSPPNTQYGPPVGFFLMNHNNEIVHKSKDLGDIPPQYLDKIIPPNFISDSPPKIYALEHDDGPPLGPGESKEITYTPTNSYGVPIQPQQYYPYPPSPTIESNNLPQQTETRAQFSQHQFNTYNRGQSETQHNPEQPPPVVYHPPYKKNKKKKKKQPHQQFALQPDSVKNTYNSAPVSSYDVPLNYVPAASSSIESNLNHYPVRPHFNVGQSFVESYSRDSNERDPPQLPATYNQNDFKTVNKSNNKKKVVYQVNTSYEDIDADEDHGLALEYPPVDDDITEAPTFNFGARHRPHAKKKPPKFDFIDSYEDSSISQEVYHTTPFTRPPKRSTATTTSNYRTRSTTKDPLFEILDTEDLRTAFQSGRHRYKLAAANKNKEAHNFVLLSSKNPQPNTYHPRLSTKSPFVSSGESSEDYSMHKSELDKGINRPQSSLETDYESYEIAERDFGLRKREFTNKRKTGRKEAGARMDTQVEKIQFTDGKRPEPTTIKPYPRFNPDVQFTKTFSSKIEQPRNQPSGLWNGQPIPGNHKIAKRRSS